MTHLSYTVTVKIPEAGLAEVRRHLPEGAHDIEAYLVINSAKPRVDITYRGRKPDGTAHKRRTSYVFTMKSDRESGKKWLAALLPWHAGYHPYVDELLNLWPDVLKDRVRRWEKISKRLNTEESK